MKKPVKQQRKAKPQTKNQSDSLVNQGGERIQKVLARAGLGSRRQIEEWIKDKQIQINGKIAGLGDRIHEGDEVRVRGRPVNLKKRLHVPTRVIVYNKPSGEVVTRHDPEGRKTVFKNLPRLEAGRWIAVGRLDINTMGLLILTTNGELANRLMHPSQEVDREYGVRVLGEVTDEVLERLKEGVELEDGFARFTDIVAEEGEGANRWYKVVIMEGRNRIVRRLWESQGLTVSRLQRVRHGPVFLPKGTRTGRCYEMTPKEVEGLMKYAGMDGSGEKDSGTLKERRGEKSSRGVPNRSRRRQ